MFASSCPPQRSGGPLKHHREHKARSPLLPLAKITRIRANGANLCRLLCSGETTVRMWPDVVNRPSGARRTSVMTMLHRVLFEDGRIRPVVRLPLSVVGILTVVTSAGIVEIGMPAPFAWLPVGIHFARNFVQGYVRGLPVSGMAFPRGVLQKKISGPLWVTGGADGPEGSILGLGVIAAGTVYFFGSRRIFTTGRDAAAGPRSWRRKRTCRHSLLRGGIPSGKRWRRRIGCAQSWVRP